LTALIGVGGAVVATYIGQQLGWYAVGAHAGFIASVAGAVGLLSLYEAAKLPLTKRNRELPPGE